MEQKGNKTRNIAMLTQIATILRRSSDTLVHDMIGAISLFVLALAMLHLPGAF